MNPNAKIIFDRNRECAQHALETCRAELINAVPTSTAHNLAYQLDLLAKAEGRVAAYANVAPAMATGNLAEVQSQLIALATRGAEDSWSGRSNDAARSRFDGVLAAIRQISENIAP